MAALILAQVMATRGPRVGPPDEHPRKTEVASVPRFQLATARVCHEIASARTTNATAATTSAIPRRALRLEAGDPRRVPQVTHTCPQPRVR